MRRVRRRTGAREVWPGVVLAVLLGVLGTACEPGDGGDTAAPAAGTASVSASALPRTSLPAAAPTRPSSPSATPARTAQPASQAPAGSALAAVGALTVKGRAPLTGYRRAQFGQAWYDADHNGCDTRNDILRRDLTHLVVKAGTHGCKVLAGDAAPDPYTGTTIHFVYGGASEIDIDHVVALGDAWQKGAQRWSAGERLLFANDPLNLLAVSASANRQKGDGDAATWLPPNRSYRCAYVARQVAVKMRYALWVTAAERAAMVRVLQGCPHQPLPAAGSVPLAAEPAPAPPAPATAPPAARPPARSGTDPRFGTCKEAKAHGYGPYYAGKDPEYAWYRDADHDGIVCE